MDAYLNANGGCRRAVRSPAKVGSLGVCPENQQDSSFPACVQEDNKQKNKPSMATLLGLNDAKPPLFPLKLHTILEQAESDGNEDIISFSSDGTKVILHKPTVFAKQIMKRYFRSERYENFDRQMIMYGFAKTRTKHFGASEHSFEFSHELFRKGQRDLAHQMKRAKQGVPGGRIVLPQGSPRAAPVVDQKKKAPSSYGVHCVSGSPSPSVLRKKKTLQVICKEVSDPDPHSTFIAATALKLPPRPAQRAATSLIQAQTDALLSQQHLLRASGSLRSSASSLVDPLYRMRRSQDLLDSLLVAPPPPSLRPSSSSSLLLSEQAVVDAAALATLRRPSARAAALLLQDAKQQEEDYYYQSLVDAAVSRRVTDILRNASRR